MVSVASPSAVSFRDPAGFVFSDDGTVRRAVTQHGRRDYDAFMRSGLYDELVRRSWLVPHTEDPASPAEGLYKILLPAPISIWTYPYEWCFSQLKEAAILTLEAQLLALEHGMSLKDATPFNVQFRQGRPVLIDTLSFEAYRERPWFGYKQFCEMFLAPLALAAERRMDFNRFLAVDLNGIPLAFTSRLLPLGTWFRFGYLTHLHLHAMSQSHFEKRQEDRGKGISSYKFPKTRTRSFVDNLLSCVKKIELKAKKTAFSDYYAECGHYSSEADQFKRQTVERWAASGRWSQVLDLGGNTGRYARIFTRKSIPTVCADQDPACVESNYRISQKERDSWMQPLVVDLANPSPDLGWAHEERASLFKRVKPDLVLALALVHHLRISSNVPLDLMARFFSRIASHLIIEFVPKEDEMVGRLLRNRDDIFFDYNETGFERSFGEFFETREKSPIPGTRRVLYFLKRR